MHTHLFFLNPTTAIAAITGNNLHHFILLIVFTLLTSVSVLLFIKYETVQKVVKSRMWLAFAFVFWSFSFYNTMQLSLTEPKINPMHPNSFMPTRLVICNADVVQLTGCSDSTASRKLKQVKDALAKNVQQEVTIKEYCNYFSLDYFEVLEFLKLIR